MRLPLADLAARIEEALTRKPATIAQLEIETGCKTRTVQRGLTELRKRRKVATVQAGRVVNGIEVKYELDDVIK